MQMMYGRHRGRSATRNARWRAGRIDRALGALRHEVVHHAEEASGEEEADRVVAIPPLRHGILHAGIEHVALRAQRDTGIARLLMMCSMADGDDEGEIEPVGP